GLGIEPISGIPSPGRRIDAVELLDRQDVVEHRRSDFAAKPIHPGVGWIIRRLEIRHNGKQAGVLVVRPAVCPGWLRIIGGVVFAGMTETKCMPELMNYRLERFLAEHNLSRRE